MSFIEYLAWWIRKYPGLDPYYHMAYIEQSYIELKEEEEHECKERIYQL
jgi:asparagine N-glycosylation enzyme membrane subunit Stt3